MNSGARLRLLQRAQTSRTRRLIYTGLGFEDVVGGGEEMSDKITVDTSPSEELTAPLAQGEIEKRNDS